MDIHKPKPVHSLREFVSEIMVVVVGILIALLLEQAVEAYRLHEKIEAAENSVRVEMSEQLGYAAMFLKLKPELDDRIAKLEAAAAAGDHAEAARLARLQVPFVMRPWSVAAWDAATSEQIVSHLDPQRRHLYEILHRQAAAMLDLEWRIKDNYATLVSARLSQGGEASTAQQLAAAERLRSDSAMSAIVGGAMIEEGKTIGIGVDQKRLNDGLERAAECRSRAAAGPNEASYVC